MLDSESIHIPSNVLGVFFYADSSRLTLKAVCVRMPYPPYMHCHFEEKQLV